MCTQTVNIDTHENRYTQMSTRNTRIKMLLMVETCSVKCLYTSRVAIIQWRKYSRISSHHSMDTRGSLMVHWPRGDGGHRSGSQHRHPSPTHWVHISGMDYVFHGLGNSQHFAALQWCIVCAFMYMLIPLMHLGAEWTLYEMITRDARNESRWLYHLSQVTVELPESWENGYLLAGFT